MPRMTMPSWIAAFAISVALFAGAAHAQSVAQYGGQGLPVTDPAEFSQSIALEITRDRMQPVRRALQQMLGAEQLNTDMEASLITFERWLGNSPSEEVTKLEDISLAGTLRRIYYLNTFEGKLVFTRYDFVRTQRGWVLSGITFGSSWNSISANPLSPGWTVTP
jgi:hypothetical protein